jgi:regulator of sigma E protease
MAKRLGVRVLKFSLGFGPRLVGFRRGDTEYCISAIPLGGFVKMAGENPDEPRTGATDEFLSRSKWERFQVLIMGPLMNILLAVVLMALVLMQGADVPSFQDQPPVIGTVLAGSPAERGGIKPKDRIVSVAGRATETWDKFFMAIGTRARRNVAIVLLRDGREMTVQVTPDAETKYEIGEIGVMPDVHPHIRAVAIGDPAEVAGLRAGDVVIAVDGETMVLSRQLSGAIATRAGVPVVFTIERGGVRRDITVTPVKRGARGVVGIGIGDDVRTIQPTPVQAVWLSLQRNYEFSGLILQTLVGLLTTETSPRQLMGPVGIAQLSGEYAAAGWLALFTLMVRDWPEPRHPEPAADPGARRRAHLHHGGRGDRAARLLRQGEGEDADGGLCPADAADGDGDLQRPDARAVGREADVLALAPHFLGYRAAT